MNPHDRLVDACESWSYYPGNLLIPVQLRSTLQRYRQQLKDKEKRLFDRTAENIGLLELNDGEDGFLEGEFQHYSQLRRHLLENRKDPKCRFIFVRAAHSLSELSCSRDTFSYLFCFHQVDPSFLDFVFSFGSTDEPLDYHMTGFNFYDTLNVPDERLLNIPKLGRSGREFRVQYLLRSLERGVDLDNETTRTIRQMAVYHTFDLVTGTAFWINIKANRLVEGRIKEATSEFPALQSRAMDSLAGSFAATLAIHITHLEWCDEDWRECINDIESKIRSVLTKAKTARIDRQPTGIKFAFTRASTHDLFEKAPASSPPNRKRTMFNLFGLRNSYSDAVDQPSLLSAYPLTQLLRETKAEGRDQIDRFMIFDTFSFDEVQQLHYFGELLESFRLVIDFSGQTLYDISENYQHLWDRGSFPLEIKQDCWEEFVSFIQRIHHIRMNLQIRASQVKSLMAWLQEGKTLFDAILQYRNAQIGHIITESLQAQSEKMEGIAFKTEKENIPIRVMYYMVLAFLPGMFVAILFQSGLVKMNGDAGPWGSCEAPPARL